MANQSSRRHQNSCQPTLHRATSQPTTTRHCFRRVKALPRANVGCACAPCCHRPPAARAQEAAWSTRTDAPGYGRSNRDGLVSSGPIRSDGVLTLCHPFMYAEQTAWHQALKRLAVCCRRNTRIPTGLPPKQVRTTMGVAGVFATWHGFRQMSARQPLVAAHEGAHTSAKTGANPGVSKLGGCACTREVHAHAFEGATAWNKDMGLFHTKNGGRTCMWGPHTSQLRSGRQDLAGEGQLPHGAASQVHRGGLRS